MTFFTLIAMTGTENLDSYLRVAVLGVVAVVFGCLPLVIACLLRPTRARATLELFTRCERVANVLLTF